MSKTTEVVFILDRSGSMAGLESDTIGGFNGMLEKQKELSLNDGLQYLVDHWDMMKSFNTFNGICRELTEEERYRAVVETWNETDRGSSWIHRL